MYISITKVDCSFISDVFSNWKEGPVKFRMHDGSECHKRRSSDWRRFPPLRVTWERRSQRGTLR
ncbi:hypothetical protein DPMN_037481 [Dreissena polymorpha]|uniref:Uncharacterized protein n=1 Tax=Dreissena polymorpha TaxID=45954 RepID=A0A9D4MEM0_DREPO|nr:hypothetical protein DPMN_037481 [Dreissena polymorpha]